MEAPKTETKKSCSVKDCKRPYRAKGYCVVHYQKWRRGEIEGATPRYRTCREENCRKATFKAGLCEPHYSAWSASKKGQPAAAPAAEAQS
ncbi:MAG: hypothetical protein V2A66_03925 [Pseudomonadota bacterium]